MNSEQLRKDFDALDGKRWAEVNNLLWEGTHKINSAACRVFESFPATRSEVSELERELQEAKEHLVSIMDAVGIEYP